MNYMINSRNSGASASGGSPLAVCRKWSTGTDDGRPSNLIIEEEASDTAYLINEAAAWENICAIVKVNHDGIINDDILADMINKVNAAVNVSRGIKAEVSAGGGDE